MRINRCGIRNAPVGLRMRVKYLPTNPTRDCQHENGYENQRTQRTLGCSYRRSCCLERGSGWRMRFMGLLLCRRRRPRSRYHVHRRGRSGFTELLELEDSGSIDGSTAQAAPRDLHKLWRKRNRQGEFLRAVIQPRRRPLRKRLNQRYTESPDIARR